MTVLTEETRELAKKHNIWTQTSKSEEHYGSCSDIQDVVNFLSKFLTVKGAYLTLSSSDDYDRIIVSWLEDLSEEEVAKAIRKRINDNNIAAKAKEKAKMSTKERLSREVIDLEKKLARTKKKLEKA